MRGALEKITKKITNRYDRKPRGWNMLINQRGNILIFSPRSSYMLRLIALGPDRYTGVEARVTGLRETRGIIEGTPPCGFRLCQGGK